MELRNYILMRTEITFTFSNIGRERELTQQTVKLRLICSSVAAFHCVFGSITGVFSSIHSGGVQMLDNVQYSGV